MSIINMDDAIKRDIKDFISAHQDEINMHEYEAIMEAMPERFRSTLLPLFRRQGVELLKYTKTIQKGDYNPETTREVFVPSNIARLDTSAFNKYTKLERITLNSKIVSIPVTCFEDCSSLKHIDLPHQIREIRGAAFRRSGLEEFIASDDLQLISPSAFAYCENLKNVVLSDSLAGIGGRAFEGCKNLKYFEENGCQYLESKTNKCYALAKILMKDAVISKKTQLILDEANTFEVINFEGSKEDWTFLQKMPKWTTQIQTKLNFKNQN